MKQLCFDRLLVGFLCVVGCYFSSYGQSFQLFMKETKEVEKYRHAKVLFQYYMVKDLDSLKLVGNELLSFSNRHKYTDGIYLAYHILGDYFIESAQEEEGIALLSQVRAYYFSREDYHNMTLVYNAIGTGYHRLGMYQKSIEYYQRSLLYGELTSDQSIAKIAQNNLGKAFMKLQQYQQATHEVEEFKTWALQHEEIALVANACSVLGEIALEQNDYPSAIAHFIECQQFAEQQNNDAIKAVAYTNMGIVYFLQGELQASEESFFEALFFRQKIKTVVALCDAYLNCGGICFEQGKTKEAIRWYTEGEELAQRYQKYNSQLELLTALQEVYQNQPQKLKQIESKMMHVNENITHQQEQVKRQDEWLMNELEQSNDLRLTNTNGFNPWWIIATVCVFSLAVLIFLQYKRGGFLSSDIPQHHSNRQKKTP